MSEVQCHLKYKTRGNASPQGKPKVYFCCHPDDFGYLFESISDEILAEQNCAVWYADTKDAVRDTNFLSDLSQMQLFVVPITSKLMYTKNHAIDIEFPFAVEHHIPVLPLMQESNLESIFNEKCGNLQFLDKNVRDVTSIPYEEKFKAFLSSVLIGDKLAQKIRNAFDAYIFLSYRKKDRKYARELMSLIHKNEFCRDIAIWYDEFLTLGENFNDAIKQALAKSDLFVMTVTPNLVEENNYIITTEYPMAKEAGKHILPAEMVKTDHNALFKNYEQLPTPTDAHNEVELSEMLLSAIRNLAIRENDDSPEHNFFIGLAYLSGIDVEVDHKRALSLISSSAESGMVEAINKLIHMYENGEGVERNYQTAVEWREKRILYSEQEYRNLPNEVSLHNLLLDVIGCGDAYRSLGKEALARKKYEYAMDLLESSDFQKKDKTILRDLSVCYDRLGCLCQMSNDFKGARNYYEKGLTISEELCRETGTEQARQDLSFVYRRMGIPAFSGANAASYREKAIAIAEELVRETGSVSSRALLLDVYRFHGVMLKISGPNNLSIARNYYEKSMAIAEDLFRELGTLQARRDLATGYGSLASICKSSGDTDTMWSYYEKELHLSEEIAHETDSVQDRNSLANKYSIIAGACEKVGDTDKALDYYENSIAIREKLVYETDGVKYILDLCRSYEYLGQLFKKRGDIGNACRYYEKGISVREELAKKNNAREDYDNLAHAYCTIANISPERRISYLQKALGIYETLRKEYPEKEYYNQRIDSIRTQLNS